MKKDGFFTINTNQNDFQNRITFPVPETLTQITQFRRELMKKAKNVGKDSKMRKFQEHANAKISGEKCVNLREKKKLLI